MTGPWEVGTLKPGNTSNCRPNRETVPLALKLQGKANAVIYMPEQDSEKLPQAEVVPLQASKASQLHIYNSQGRHWKEV